MSNMKIQNYYKVQKNNDLNLYKISNVNFYNGLVFIRFFFLFPYIVELKIF